MLCPDSCLDEIKRIKSAEHRRLEIAWQAEKDEREVELLAKLDDFIGRVLASRLEPVIDNLEFWAGWKVISLEY